MPDSKQTTNVIATAVAAPTVLLLTTAVAATLWLWRQGAVPPVAAFAAMVLFSKLAALLLVAGRDGWRGTRMDVFSRHLAILMYVYLYLYLTVILAWVTVDRTHRGPLLVGCLGVLGCSTLLYILHFSRRRTAGARDDAA